MRKIILVFAFSIAFSGCAAETPKNAGSNTATNNENRETITNTGANNSPETESPPILKGEKIEKPSEVDFKADGLPPGWQKVETSGEKPAEFDTTGGVLKLKIPGGTDLFAERQSAPRLLKPVSGDFEIETKVKFAPKSDYQGAGILIFNNEKNFLRLERGLGGVDGGMSGVRFDKSENGDYSAISGTDDNPTESGEIELKLIRKGGEFIALMRENIDSEWKEIGVFEGVYPETVQVGIIGVSTTEEITAEFAYIRIMPAA